MTLFLTHLPSLLCSSHYSFDLHSSHPSPCLVPLALSPVPRPPPLPLFSRSAHPSGIRVFSSARCSVELQKEYPDIQVVNSDASEAVVEKMKSR